MKTKKLKGNSEETRITKELLEYCDCSRTTLISWIKNWRVNGKPIGFLRGGRWIVNVERLKKFMRGEGEYAGKQRKKRGRQSKSLPRGKLDCANYQECLLTYRLMDQAPSCVGCKDYQRS